VQKSTQNIELSVNGLSDITASSSNTFNFNEWTFVAGLKNTTHICVYLNSTLTCDASTGLVGNTTNVWYFGGFYASLFSEVQLDNIFFFNNRTLSTTDLDLLKNNQFINPTGLVAYYAFDEITNSTQTPFSNLSDKSGNGNTLTNNGATWIGDSVSGEGYYSFNGVANPLNRTSGLNVFNRYTFSYWFFRNSNSSVQVQLWNGNSTSANAQNQFFTFNSGDVITFRQGNGTAFSSRTTTVPINTWTHIAGTFNGVNTSLYKNGILESTNAAVLPMYQFAPTLAIGADGGFATKFNGTMD
jgi:hypothetical protein